MLTPAADHPFLVAPASVRWTAKLVTNDELPRHWGEFLDDDEVRLKDTRGRYWRNRLEAPNRFVYRFPTTGHPERPWEQALVARLARRVAASAQLGKPLRVRLYATPGSRNESYGAWAVEQLVPNVAHNASELVLRRLHVQPAVDGARPEGGAAYRSRNEAAHATLLAELFPGWRLVHEPETVLDVHEPSVVDGVAQDVHEVSRSYTCDFVLAQGTKRLCVESKPSEEFVTAEALTKCRVLRDTTLTRVLVLAGDARDVRWFDLGAPEAPQEAWLTSDALRAALGV